MTSLNLILSPADTEKRKMLDFQSGDRIRVWQKVKEGEKTRLQAFEGLVLARKHGNEAGATFTVRKISGGVGVERVFPLHSPEIDRVEVISRASKHKRSKLYYIRDRASKEIRKKMKHLREVVKVEDKVEHAPELNQENQSAETPAEEATKPEKPE